MTEQAKECELLNAKKFNLVKCISLTMAIIASLFLVFYLAISIYAKNYYHAAEEVNSYIETNLQNVNIIMTKDYLAYIPEGATEGIVFYPGALVESKAYAPIFERCAEEGIAGIIVDMPKNLAILDANKGNKVIKNFPEIDNWYIAGHSLGGVMASKNAVKSKELYKGIILLASYPANKVDLPVLSVYGSADTVLNIEAYKENIQKNAPEAVETVIPGGIHSYFALYGHQKGDGEPTVSFEDQLEITVNSILDFISQHTS